MAQALFTNNAAGTLSAAVASTDTLIYLGSGQGALFPTITGSNYFYITVTMLAAPYNMEIMKVTNVSTNTLTVVRGQDNTVANASGFSISDPVELRVTAVVLQELQATAATVTTTIASGATGTTQAIGTNNTTIATTAYADTHVPKDVGSQGVGVILFLMLSSGSTIAAGGTVSGSLLQGIAGTYTTGTLTYTPGIFSGTWRNVTKDPVSPAYFGTFQRIS